MTINREHGTEIPELRERYDIVLLMQLEKHM